MTAFIIGAAVAVLLVLALLLRPFFRMSASVPASQRQLNAAILREQLAKLDQDLADGTLRQDDYAQARAEVQRRVLEDTSEEDAAPTLRAPKRTLAALALLVPLAAVAVYFITGNPGSMSATSVARAPATDQDVERMVQSLADRLAKEPGNLKGWAMLAKSYKVMGRPADAQIAFEKAGAFIDDDAQMLADYADVVATNANGNLSGKPAALLDKALKVDPNNGMALWLAGTAAMNEKNYDRTLELWERLAKMLQPGSEDAQTLQGAINEVRTLAGKGPAPSVAIANGAANSNASSGVGASAGIAPAGNANPGASVSGTVELAPTLKAQAAPTDTVMVIARVPGTRMPVAVLRVHASDLPLKFTLDDSLSMSPQALLSAAKEVDIEARISKTGLAKPEPGDLISSVQTVKVGSKDVALKVAQVRN
jgi:cytochrome c-type biogenesis protein CcmH